MASELSIGPAQHGGIRSEPAGDDEPGDRGDAGSERGRRVGRLDCPSAVEKAARVLPRWRQDQGRERRCSTEAGGIVDDPDNVVFEVGSVAPDEPALAPHLPDFPKKSVGEALAACTAAKDHNVTAEKSGTWTELDDGLAPQAGAVEQDGLGRQEFESCTSGDR